MESTAKENTKICFVNGEKIPVSEAVFQAIRSLNNRTRYYARKEQHCALTNYQKCNGECENCKWRANSHLIYYGHYTQERFPTLTAIENTENEAIRKITQQKIYARAEKLAKHGSLILQLRFEHGYSFREISECLGIKLSTVYKSYGKILDYFRKHKKEYF